MSSINWDVIDDYEFVYLAADLLRKLGFVDIHVQGSGPDGGLDLIATELVPFAIQGAQPFRWGIQCKFSKTSIEKSVNDSEIRDVTGILNSDRYSVHDLRGYMVITNRKIVQNVMERLRGINRTTAFRTAYIDGVQLQNRLAEFPDLIEKYFGEIKTTTEGYGKALVVSDMNVNTDNPFEIEISPVHDEHTAIKSKALLDTGADVSIIPKRIIEAIPNFDYSYRAVRYVTGETSNVISCYLNIKIGSVTFNSVEFLALDTDYVLIGQDLLGRMIVLLDGPNKSFKIWSGK